jgi:hypothetical protein
MATSKKKTARLIPSSDLELRAMATRNGKERLGPCQRILAQRATQNLDGVAI